MSSEEREMTTYEWMTCGKLPDHHAALLAYRDGRAAYWDLPLWLRWLVSKWAGTKIAAVFWCGEPWNIKP